MAKRKARVSDHPLLMAKVSNTTLLRRTITKQDAQLIMSNADAAVKAAKAWGLKLGTVIRIAAEKIKKND